MHPSSTMAADARAVGRWLAAFAVMTFIVVLVGGATRLTESGLSITEWKPVSGVVPPMTEAAWQSEFAKYQQIPQYERMNAGMTLSEFKGIYLWEFWHRIAARLIGLAFAVPFFWYALRRRIPAFAAPRVYLIGVLLVTQAAMGWWMVTSGLTERTEVSQYRLAAHLTVAFVMLAITVWTAADLLDASHTPAPARVRGARETPFLAGLLALTFVTSASGALVAGLRAGRIYNTFPLMNGSVMPSEYGMLSPWWLNAFENHAAVQFNHRVLALTTFVAAIALWALFRRTRNVRLAARMRLVLGAAVLQLTLGITTLLLAVPISLGVAHQGGAALLLASVVLAWHASRTRVTGLERRMEPAVAPPRRSQLATRS